MASAPSPSRARVVGSGITPLMVMLSKPMGSLPDGAPAQLIWMSSVEPLPPANSVEV